jgi:hypothetical protein
MSISYLNSIFFQTNEIVDIVDITKFQPYSLSKDRKHSILFSLETPIAKNIKNDLKPNVDKTVLEKVVENLPFIETKKHDKKEQEHEKMKEKDNLIYVKQDDTLFWCLYILQHGFTEYHNIGRNYGVKELEEKTKIYDFVKKNPMLVKNTNTKITNVAIKEILSELISVQRKMSFQCMIATLVYYQKNLIIVDKSRTSMLEFWIDRDNIPSFDLLASRESNELMQTFVLHRDERGNYKLQLENISVSTIMDMRASMYSWEIYDKPLRGLSTYKTVELEEIGKKLKIDMRTKKYKKNELYEEIQKKIGLAFS